jgi:hypothetical protein
MAKVLCIHGIGQEYEAEETLADSWVPALCGGVSNAGGKLERSEVAMCFYGGLFRPQESVSKSAADLGKATDDKIEHDRLVAPLGEAIDDEFEHDLLIALADAAGPVAPDSKSFKRPINAMLQQLVKTPFFGQCAQEVVVWSLKQVRWYLDDYHLIRQRAQKRLINAINDDTRVVVAHSLGTVVAYETLCAHTDLPVRTLVTLGSPLGISVLRPRVQPSIAQSPAPWPVGLTTWFNIADRTDIVALKKSLAGVFGDRVQDRLVDNGATMHDVRPYLTAAETGQAIIAGLGKDEVNNPRYAGA